MTETPTVSDRLNDDQIEAVTKILRHTPIAALVNNTVGEISTFHDITEQMRAMAACAADSLNKLDQTQNELWQLKADLKTAGRVFKLMTGEE